MSLSLRARPSRTAAALTLPTTSRLMLVGCASNAPSDAKSGPAGAGTRTVTDVREYYTLGSDRDLTDDEIAQVTP